MRSWLEMSITAVFSVATFVTDFPNEGYSRLWRYLFFNAWRAGMALFAHLFIICASLLNCKNIQVCNMSLLPISAHSCRRKGWTVPAELTDCYRRPTIQCNKAWLCQQHHSRLQLNIIGLGRKWTLLNRPSRCQTRPLLNARCESQS